MKFYTNFYCDANDLIRKKINKADIENDIFNRWGEDNFENVYNRLNEIEDDKNIVNKACKFIKNASIEELKEYVTVYENSIRYEKEETSHCDCTTLAYLVDIDIDFIKLIKKIKEETAIER